MYSIREGCTWLDSTKRVVPIYQSKEYGETVMILNSYAAFAGEGGGGVSKLSQERLTEKGTVNFHLSYREKPLSFSLPPQGDSESHSSPHTFSL